MNWAGAQRARLERDTHMREARECRDKYRETLDRVYAEMVKIHVRSARAFNRHAWKGPRLKK